MSVYLSLSQFTSLQSPFSVRVLWQYLGDNDTHITNIEIQLVNHFSSDRPILYGPVLQMKFLTTPFFNLLEIKMVPNEAVGVPQEKQLPFSPNPNLPRTQFIRHTLMQAHIK